MKNRGFGGNILASGQAVDHTHKIQVEPVGRRTAHQDRGSSFSWACRVTGFPAVVTAGRARWMRWSSHARRSPGYGDQVPTGEFAARVPLSLTSRRGHFHHQPALGGPVGSNTEAAGAFHSEGQHYRLEGPQVLRPARRGHSAGRYGGGRPSSCRSRPRPLPFCPARTSRGRGDVTAKDEGDGR